MQITYLFNNHYFCDDVYKHLYSTMVGKGYNCYKITLSEDSKEKVNAICNSLKNKNTVLITSDHSDYSDKIIDIIKPIKKFYGMHDLGIHRVDDNVDGWHILLPHEMWRSMYDNHNIDGIDVIGHGKFYEEPKNIEYNTVFFASLMYVYLKRKPEDFYLDFKKLFDLNIPVKFPKMTGIQPIIDFLRGKNVKILDMNKESFDIILRCNNMISNSCSSTCVEAAMVGCNAFNIGSGYGEKCKRFNIKCIKTTEISKDLFIGDRKQPMREFMLNTNKVIDIITSIN